MTRRNNENYCFHHLIDSNGSILVIFLAKIAEENIDTKKVIANINKIDNGLKVKIVDEPRIFEMVYILKNVNPISSIEDKVNDINPVISE